MEKAGKLSPADKIKLTNWRAGLLAGGLAGGENSAEELERLLKLEKADKLSPADEIKLSTWRAGVSAGATNRIKEFEKLLELEEADELGPDAEIKLTNWRAGLVAGGENSAEEWRRLVRLEKADKLSPAEEIKLTNWRERSAKEWRRLLKLEKSGKLSPDDEIKLTKMRADQSASGSAGGENAAEEWRRLLRLEEADELGPDDEIKLTNWRAEKSSNGTKMVANRTTNGRYSQGERAEWNRMFELLCVYKEENGDCLVPQNSGSKLCNWVKQQRAQYRLKGEGKPSHLSEERIALLEALGFTWKANLSWEDRFQQLEKIGSCSIPTSGSFYGWCIHQVESRQRWRKKEMEYQRELSSWEKSNRRGDRPTRRDETRYEKWIKREERLDELGFWDEFRPAT